MTPRVTHALTLGIAALGASLAAGGSAMGQDLDPPVTVETGFLEAYDAGGEFLRGALMASGAGHAFEISEGEVSLTSAAALASVNRIRAFSGIEYDSLSPPFVLLTIMEGDKPVQCATIEPRSIVPDITAADFGVDRFEAADADTDAIARCRVDPEAKADYAGMTRDELRQMYFNDSGDLKSEHSDLARDPTLAAALIDAGYFVMLGDVSGRLKLR